MVSEYKLNKFAALEPETKDEKSTEKEREAFKKAVSDCTTKIMNTLAFRKLAGKTQVILSLTGPDVRTRLTHTIEVAKIAKDLCVELGLNADLAEAIALSHDIGHTPFGHVGERTLREIMCGCDTLGGKVRDDDFGNSGFKHNLQSFRILKDLTKIDKNNDDEKEVISPWPYIFWGAPAHTKMSYAKPGAGMDDEILISSKHCDRVYVCHYHEKKECKRNIQRKKGRRSELNKKEICKPWYCAKLKPMENRDEVDKNRLRDGESTREYLKKEPIKQRYLDQIFCSHKCYLAKLWEHRYHVDKKEKISKEYPFLFDHPFPNSYYADSINDYFQDKDGKHYISFEAIVVSQADEIAQRQQDLEDGIRKGLLPFTIAKDEDVRELISSFNDNNSGTDEYDKVPKETKTAEDLGKFLANFYKKILIIQTKSNVSRFSEKVTCPEKINIYSLMNILYEIRESLLGIRDTKTDWLLQEFRKNKKVTTDIKSLEFNKHIEHVFEIYDNSIYLCLLSYSHLEKYTKYFEENKIEVMIELLSKCIKTLEDGSKHSDFDSLCKLKLAFKSLVETYEDFKNTDKKKDNACIYEKVVYRFLKTLDELRNYLPCLSEYDEFFINKNKKHWKNIGDLNLHSFYILYEMSKKYFTKEPESPVYSESIKNFQIADEYTEIKYKKVFDNWKTVLKRKANIVLTELVSFTDERSDNDKEKNKKEALGEFEKKQGTTILKSEPVEKNDGKANYILRRLFKAYVANSHQLPDSGLRYILSCLLNNRQRELLIKNEVSSFKEISEKLIKTIIAPNPDLILENIAKNEPCIKMAELSCQIENLRKTKPERADKIKQLKQERKDTFKKLTEGTSNEIKAALEKRKKLFDYLIRLEKEEDAKNISKKLFSDDEKDKAAVKNELRQLRAILDNPILNAVPYWQSILTRAICDYIASLTDQEAVNEYEKLYAGIMELA